MTNEELKKVYNLVLDAYYELSDTRNYNVKDEEETERFKKADQIAYSLKCTLDEIIHERIVSGKAKGFYNL